MLYIIGHESSSLEYQSFRKYGGMVTGTRFLLVAGIAFASLLSVAVSEAAFCVLCS